MKINRFLILVISFFIQYAGATTYYINADSGNDNYSGTSVDRPWASLEKLNTTTLKPGDYILIKAGTKYYGQLICNGSGTKNQPIIIDSYGEGSKPGIHGEGKKLFTLLLRNVEYWQIRNIEITNLGEQRQAKRRGVMILAEDFGDCRGIVLDGLEIHHVNGSLVKKEGGGSAIYWKNSGDRIKSRFVDLMIQNCYLHHCGRNGINSRGYTNRNDWYPSLGVIIRNNLLEKIPGDGIVPIGCDGAIVEFNVLRDFPDILSHQEAAAGIWPWSSDNTIIQFNEVSGHKAKWDGQGFDADYNCIGTIIQYNYSHDNYGGFLLVCNNGNTFGSAGNVGTKNAVIRYNVSVNDGIRPYPTERKGPFSPVFHITGPVENTAIYNNVIIPPKNSLDQNIVYMDNWGGPWPVNTTFENNIFYSEGENKFSFNEDVNTQFIHNNYFGEITNLPKDAQGIYSDPKLVNAEARGSGFGVLNNFVIKDSSALSNEHLGISKRDIKKFKTKG
ncbi:right-handed parallel beta-helix repeat-containing protein [Gaetbulibacter aestuarii]|uniref:Right-handed parallel beta-helix repeat-containing protein n=1 Tax=Gaetbulibacter aestuarii TaxID=1502358 RepID=A0ABW7MVH0_9FLAO